MQNWCCSVGVRTARPLDGRPFTLYVARCYLHDFSRIITNWGEAKFNKSWLTLHSFRVSARPLAEFTFYFPLLRSGALFSFIVTFFNLYYTGLLFLQITRFFLPSRSFSILQTSQPKCLTSVVRFITKQEKCKLLKRYCLKQTFWI
jgi:hypothetical protein